MNVEEQARVTKSLNSWYGNEFEVSKEGKKIFTTFEFTSYQELGSIIHGINTAINMLCLSNRDMSEMLDLYQLGNSIEVLTELNQRFLSHSLFECLDVVTDIIE